MTKKTLLLLMLFQIKHFVADFPLQTSYMLQKFRQDWGFFWPLMSHSAVHGFITFIIVMIFTPMFWWLAVFDFVSHFVIDRMKASNRFFGRYNDARQKSFWNSLGADQMVHHMVHILIIWFMVMAPEDNWNQWLASLF